MKRSLNTRWLAVVSLACCFLGCSRGTTVPPLSGTRHRAEIRQLNKTASVYRLYRVEGKAKRLVTEAYMEGGQIQTLLPTPIAWGCTGQGFARGSEVLATVAFGAIGDYTPSTTIELLTDGSVLLQKRHRLSLPRLRENWPTNSGEGGVLLIDVSLPIQWKHLHDLVDFLGQADLVIRPKLDIPWESVPQKVPELDKAVQPLP